jgi:hypothetical protein
LIRLFESGGWRQAGNTDVEMVIISREALWTAVAPATALRMGK